MRWLTRLPHGSPGTVTFCDGCGTVCDAACRTDPILQGAGLRALSLGGWR